MAEWGQIGRCVAVLALTLWTVAVQGQRKPAAKSPTPAARASGAESAISISVVPVSGGPLLPGGSSGQGTLQVGKVSASSGAQRAGVTVDRKRDSMVVRTDFGIRLDSRGSSSGTATLSAFLMNPDPRCEVLLDGVKLGPTPRPIQRRVSYGAVNQHKLEVEIPYTVSEDQGRLARNIGFVATAE